MAQLVFLHGPGAGACADAFYYQTKHFPGSVAPTLPGHLEGTRCPDVARYTEWVRGWLWSRDLSRGVVLVGYTLGACIALHVRPRLSGRGEGPGGDDGRCTAQDASPGDVRDAAARRGRYEGLRRLAPVPAACHEARGARLAGAAAGAASPGRPAVPVPRSESHRRLRRARSPRHAAAEAAAAARRGRPDEPARIREGSPRRRARLAIREALRGGTLSTHRDSRQGQRADRRVRRRAVRELTSPCTS